MQALLRFGLQDHSKNWVRIYNKLGKLQPKFGIPTNLFEKDQQNLAQI